MTSREERNQGTFNNSILSDNNGADTFTDGLDEGSDIFRSGRLSWVSQSVSASVCAKSEVIQAGSPRGDIGASVGGSQHGRKTPSKFKPGFEVHDEWPGGPNQPLCETGTQCAVIRL